MLRDSTKFSRRPPRVTWSLGDPLAGLYALVVRLESLPDGGFVHTWEQTSRIRSRGDTPVQMWDGTPVDVFGSTGSGVSTRSLVIDYGHDDWVQLIDVYDLCSWLLRDAPSVDCRAFAVGLVVDLLVSGDFQAGDITDGGFVPWDTPIGDVILRITREWLALDDPRPGPGDIAWLDLCETARIS